MQAWAHKLAVGGEHAWVSVLGAANKPRERRDVAPLKVSRGAVKVVIVSKTPPRYYHLRRHPVPLNVQEDEPGAGLTAAGNSACGAWRTCERPRPSTQHHVPNTIADVSLTVPGGSPLPTRATSAVDVGVSEAFQWGYADWPV